MNIIDAFLNRITMYRLVLYVLIALVVWAFVISFFGLTPFSPWSILFSGILVTAVCWMVNEACAYILKVPPNVESVYITALIITLIISPAPPSDLRQVGILVWASIFAIVSKYLINIGRKHVFNPAAFGAVGIGLALGGAASWWVGANPWLLWVTLIGGLLIVRKTQRFDMVITFIVVALITATASLGISRGIFSPAWQTLAHAPILFFAFIMLTEPLTTPPTRRNRLIYATLVGILWTPAAHIGSLYFTPELALVLGNVFSFLVSPRGRYMLRLKDVEGTSASTSDFVFESDRPIPFQPGQYMEWTLPHAQPDARGNRRYFTIASSPTESDIRLGVKFYDPSSSFKRALARMRAGDTISTGQLAGEFVLSDDPARKLVFIAGGIGITPFRSMIRYLVDRREERSILLLYANRRAEDIAYRPLFDEAAHVIGLKTIYAVTEEDDAAARGYETAIDMDLIKREIPDYLDRTFYLSGPRAMVLAFERTLHAVGIPRKNIKKDFFPGFV